jgi:magnesium-transporting ATPase (P-type)
VEGTRVLALGTKSMGMEGGAGAGAGAEEDRGEVEQGLAFAGLAAFRTQIRADSRRVVKQLTDAGACALLYVWMVGGRGGWMGG